MDDSSVNPGLSAFTQTLPSVTAVDRQLQIAPQRASTTPAEAQKPATSAETRQTKPTRKELVEEVGFANAVAAFLNQKVSFNYDKRIDQIVVKVTRENGEEVIRQIPSEEMIKLTAKFRKEFRGLIVDRTG